MLSHQSPHLLIVIGLGVFASDKAQALDYLDLAQCGAISTWGKPITQSSTQRASWADVPGDCRCAGVKWAEERDVREIRVRFQDGQDPGDVRVEYWWRNWPVDPPTMPTIEDPVDDPWQGSWLTARPRKIMEGKTCVLTFTPLEVKENPRADLLPDVQYRRTLKMRMIWPDAGPRLKSMQVFSETTIEPLAIRIEFGAGAKNPTDWTGSLEVFNGKLQSAKPWHFQESDKFEAPATWKHVSSNGTKGIVALIASARPSPPGSNDATVVTVRGQEQAGQQMTSRTFSFSTLDLAQGPIFVPDLHVYVTRADDSQSYSAETFRKGQKIRDRIPLETEQTYERATREIPPLDPWKRQNGGDRVYLPVAADASWQKFTVEYGGNIFMNKQGTKAKGAELSRLQWPGETLKFRFGTGEPAYYRDDHKAQVSVLEDDLPIVLNRWEDENFSYEEEAFATLLDGPLDPNDPARSEQTPAVCMVRLRVKNKRQTNRSATVRLNIEPAESLALTGRRIYSVNKESTDANKRSLRAVLTPAYPPEMPIACEGGTQAENSTIRMNFTLNAGGEGIIVARIPFVSDLDDAAAQRLEQLDYKEQRERVAAYWRNLVSQTTRFTTPEPKFNAMARAVIPHIHLSTTKDSQSGLFMVPAASYYYLVCLNEACFQTQLLDALGDTQRATQYLKTCTALQGSRTFPGKYTEPHDGIFHGAKVNDEYDYTASEYCLDHGTVLWTLAKHYFYTRDASWLKETLPHMLKAIEWIERQRKQTQLLDIRGQKVLEYGLLPAGHLEDNGDWGYWFAVNAYCVAGMVETAAVMKEINHPDAARIAAAAADYRDALRSSIRRSMELAPVVRMRDGTYSPYVPTRPYQRFRMFGPLRVQYYSRYHKPDLPCYRLSATREVLYGPMLMLNLQIFDSSEPIANWILDDWEDNLTLSSSGGFNVHGFTDDNLWFSQGGMVFQANLQNPIWAYLHRHETPAAIRSVYNAFVSCLYPNVNAFTEEYREWRHASGPFYKCPDEAKFVHRMRDMLVMESGDELWLAAGVPRRWLASREGIQVDSLNTIFGPVSYSLRAGETPGSLVAKITPPSRNAPERVWLYLRLPEGKEPHSIRAGDTEIRFDAQQERILLPASTGPIEVHVNY